MTEEEVGRIVLAIRSAYPSHFKQFGSEDIRGMLLAWSLVLSEYDFHLASRGLQLFLANDRQGFPPSPGQVVDCIVKIKHPVQNELTGTEAWALVRKAIRNSYYNAEAEFEKLPTACQRAIGSAASLREIGQLDTEKVETVEQSHFIKAFETVTKRERENLRMPEAIKQLIQKMDTDRKQLEEKQERALLHD